MSTQVESGSGTDLRDTPGRAHVLSPPEVVTNGNDQTWND